MKKTIIILFCWFLSYNFFAGCSAPSFSSSVGVNLPYGGNGTYTVMVNAGDSFQIAMKRGKCYEVIKTTISIDGIEIHNSPRSCYLKLACKSGSYHFSAMDSRYYSTNLYILFIVKPKLQDSTNTISQPTNVLSLINLNPELLFYPNPAEDEITLLNETEAIKKVSFYSLAGQVLSSFEVNNTKINIPLNNYPAGIYFIHVATLSNKIIIKKISVL